MKSHHLRVVLILVAFGIGVTTLILGVLLKAPGEVIAAALSWSALSFAAALDALKVDARRKDPTDRAIEDDVTEEL